ncbi:MAG: hypothetical protein J6N54_05585, partial [Bacteroidales bacterium]|nr:hypothetical protein [Bacteroidales bacterium]
MLPEFMLRQQIRRWQTGTGPFWLFGPQEGRRIKEITAKAAKRTFLMFDACFDMALAIVKLVIFNENRKIMSTFAPFFGTSMNREKLTGH